jgi:hypothetical protein
MTDAKSAWNDTGEQLTALGSKLGAHFEKQRAADGEQARAETKEAIKRLGGAVQDAFDAVGAAAKDEAVRQDVKQVGRSLISALDVTFREVSDEVKKAFDRSSTDSPTADKPAQGSTAGSPTQDSPPQSPPPEPGSPEWGSPGPSGTGPESK